jgi:alpha-ketoglutarate-dependent taurine dioxygenase
MGTTVTNIKPHIGAIVEVNRRSLLDDAVVAQCLDLLERRGVLVFPRIGLSDAEQLAFTDRLGTRLSFTGLVSGAEEGIYRITLDPRQNPQPEYVHATFFWHMDGLTADVIPPRASLLSARSVAAKGGQTEFANTYAAYEHLPEAEQADIQGLRVLHSLPTSLKQFIDTPTEQDIKRWNIIPPKEHPLVWKHRSGRQSLVVGTTADRVIGQPLPEGRALLARLLEWTAQPDFHYRHQWQTGDLVIWDNCGTVHRVIPYAADSGRLMHRTTLEGSEPLA